MKVAILAKGPTLKDFGGDFDEVWGLNQVCKSHALDRLFVMDDLKSRMPYWDPDFPEWLKQYDRPFFTSRAYPEWPTAERFPIEDVCQHFGVPLGLSFYSSVDYMIALAVYRGADEIHLFGVDCSDPKREETVRVGIALWIGVAMGRGIRVVTRPGSYYQWFTVPGVCYEKGMYGYVGPPKIEALAGVSGVTEIHRGEAA